MKNKSKNFYQLDVKYMNYGMFEDKEKVFKEQLKDIRGDYEWYWLYTIIGLILLFKLFS